MYELNSQFKANDSITLCSLRGKKEEQRRDNVFERKNKRECDYLSRDKLQC